MHCKRIQPNLSAFIDGELDRNRSQAVAEHLAVCALCEDELRQLRQVIHWTRGVPEHEPPAALPTQILHAVAHVGTRQPQPLWALLAPLQLPRTFAWVACTSAAAAVAVAVASHRGPVEPRYHVPTASHEASVATATVRPVLLPPASRNAPAVAAPAAQPAALTPPLQSASTAVPQPAVAVVPAAAPDRPVATRPAPGASQAPSRSAPVLNVTIEVPPVITEAAPMPVTELKQMEPTAPMEMEPGPGMMALGTMTPGPDAAPAGVMGITTEAPKMMTGSGSSPVPGDYGVEELRQFLQEQKNPPVPMRDPTRERNPG